MGRIFSIEELKMKLAEPAKVPTKIILNLSDWARLLKLPTSVTLQGVRQVGPDSLELTIHSHSPLICKIFPDGHIVWQH